MLRPANTILTPKQAVRAIELGNLCKLDGLRTVVKLKERFYMKGLLTIACNTFLR